MKAKIQKTIRKYGYEIRKAPFPDFRSVSVQDLSLHYLMATRGQALNFIQVGANDGKSVDPIRQFILNYPWKGLLIEPQPDVFERLTANYAGLQDRLAFENVAVSGNSEPIALYRSPAKSTSIGAATVASSNPKITARQLGLKPHELDKIMVPTAKLDDLVAKHNLANLHLLQLDTEGFDWDVLQTLDLSKTRPLMIGFEHGHLSPQVIGRMVRHLNLHDYDVHFGGYESDSIALRSDFIQA